MRFIKWIVVVLFFLFFMVFFIQNQAEFNTAMNLKFHLFTLNWEAQPLPFYLWVIVFFVFGVICSIVLFLFDRIRLGARLRSANAQVKRLQAELDSLKATATPPSTTAPDA